MDLQDRLRTDDHLITQELRFWIRGEEARNVRAGRVTEILEGGGGGRGQRLRWDTLLEFINCSEIKFNILNLLKCKQTERIKVGFHLNFIMFLLIDSNMLKQSLPIASVHHRSCCGTRLRHFFHFLMNCTELFVTKRVSLILYYTIASNCRFFMETLENESIMLNPMLNMWSNHLSIFCLKVLLAWPLAVWQSQDSFVRVSRPIRSSGGFWSRLGTDKQNWNSNFFTSNYYYFIFYIWFKLGYL